MAGDPFRAELERLDAQAANRKRQAELDQTLAPADPELTQLFTSFAERMPREKAVPFYGKPAIVNCHVEVRGKWWRRARTESFSRTERVEVTRGWPIQTSAKTRGTYDSGYRLRLGLAIDVDGIPYIGLWIAYTTASVQVAPASEKAERDSHHDEHHTGRLRGANQRAAILKALPLMTTRVLERFRTALRRRLYLSTKRSYTKG
ncbi:MAG: hypothetical protein ACLP0J_24485 [Solirubrobacteraceae bacterium]